ncbi:NAD-P-binding protein [Xylogone sp. PMI_703]|nr:NAD-P-binding protein [Xylogone sp. PMI_703]
MGLGLEGTHVLITGAAGFIGSSCVAAFLSVGSYVTAADINEAKLDLLLDHPKLFKVVTDITSEEQLNGAFRAACARFGVVSCCVALASLDLSVLKHPYSVLHMEASQFQNTLHVNVLGTFITSQIWLRQLVKYGEPSVTRNPSLIIVGSESGHFGERQNPDYASGKSAVQYGLLQSLKAAVPKLFEGARVNAIAPGPVDTPQFRKECEGNPNQLYEDSRATSASGKPVPTAAVAKGVVFLASESWSGSIMGQVLNVDGGKFGKLMWGRDEQ